METGVDDDDEGAEGRVMTRGDIVKAKDIASSASHRCC